MTDLHTWEITFQQATLQVDRQYININTCPCGTKNAEVT